MAADLEGLPAIVGDVCTYFLLPTRPAEAKEEEETYATKQEGNTETQVSRDQKAQDWGSSFEKEHFGGPATERCAAGGIFEDAWHMIIQDQRVQRCEVG
jgi:hypothetical protein